MEQRETIQKWFIRVALIHLTLTIIGSLIPAGRPEVERFSTFIISNLGYYMMYFFTGFIPRYQLRFVRKQVKVYKIALLGFSIFSYVFIISGLICTLGVIGRSIFLGEFFMLFYCGGFMGVVLGGYSLKNHTMYLKKSLY